MNRLTLILAAVVAVGAAFGVGGWLGYDRGYDVSVAEHNTALIEVERQNIARTKEYIRNVDRVAQNHQVEIQKLESNLAGTNDAVDSLHAVISRANSRTDTGATAIADAARARSLLAECAARYRDMARTADGLRATVLGLQAYALEVSRAQP